MVKMSDYMEDDSVHSDTQDDTIVNEKNQNSSRPSNSRHTRSRHGSIDSRFNEENLGDSFEDTPWCPPSIEKAKQFKEAAIIRGGNAPLRTVQVCRATDLGPGVSLYFQFLKSITICLFCMSIFSIPAIAFSYFGERIPREDHDSIGFYQFTLGNIGYDSDSLDYTEKSKCKYYTATQNTTCIHIDGYEFTTITVGTILSFCEILQFLAFMLTILYLQHRIETLQISMKKDDISARDYSIIVRDLPPDCSFEQVLSHFSNLYGLDTRDWRYRPPVEGAHTVRNSDHSTRIAHIGTWVSECTLFKRIGRYIVAYKDQENLTTTLFRTRARMKMFADDTPHAKGPNPKKYKHAEKEMMKTAIKVDELTKKILTTKHLAFGGDMTRFGKSASRDVEDGYQDYNTQIDAPVIAAFVTFEYSESMARCVEDYTRFSSFPQSLFYPHDLKFRGRRIKVKQAPEPDDIVFENLETSTFSKRLRRLRTTAAAIVTLLISFIIILQASSYKEKFARLIPNLSYCSNIIPQQYIYRNNQTSYSNLVLTRPLADSRSYYDSQCDTTIPGSFYAVYTTNNNFNDPVATYNINSCLSGSTENLCPTYNEESYCPCLLTESQEQCSTFQCAKSSTDPQCKSFKADLIGECYCFEEITSLITRGLGWSIYTDYSQFSTTDSCKSFFYWYTGVELFTYFATFLVIVINVTLEYVLLVLNKSECHGSVSNEQGSYMIKIFVAQYVNMAVVVLVAFGKINNLPNVLASSFIFQGTYTNFNSAWYGNVGAYLMLTYVAQAAFTPAYAIFQYLLIYPLSRFLVYPSIRTKRNTSIAMQDDLNQFEVGPVFETSKRTAQVLSLVFFAMTYATGLPLLMPLACVTFFLYFNIDKYLICRFYHRPPRISEGVIRNVVFFLPYAAVIRLAFACWMFGNSSFFPSSIVDIVIQLGTINLSTREYSTWLSSLSIIPHSMESRLFKPNVFPLFLLLLITVGLKLGHLFFRHIIPLEILLKYMISCFKKLCCNCTNKISPETFSRRSSINGYELMQLNDVLRQEVAPYSEQYYSYVISKDEIPNTCYKMCCTTNNLFLSEQEIIDGWVLVDHERYVLKSKVWLYDMNFGGSVKRAGDFKRTFEVISDQGCSSYNLETIPAYKKAIIGLEQGANNLEVDHVMSLIEKYERKRSSQIKTTQENEKIRRSSRASRGSVELKSEVKPLTNHSSPQKGNTEEKKMESDSENGDDSDDSTFGITSTNMGRYHMKAPSELPPVKLPAIRFDL